MNQWLIAILIIVIIAIIWYLMRERARAAEQQRLDASRRLQAGARATERAPLAAGAAAATGTDAEGAGSRVGDRLQEAADRAAGVGFERATGQMEEMTADLAEARREADLTAERLASKADEALAAIQAAAAVHGGAVPGDGTRNCPPGYPVKGSMASMLYREAMGRDYDQTIADVCFQSVAAAEAAGFLSASRAEAVIVEEIAVGENEETGQIDAIVADTVLIRDRENGERADVVAEAIEAADAGGVPPGAIRGDGGRECPIAYPIKGNRSSMLYHEPGTPTYDSTVPEFCFSNVAAATAAGFSATQF
jgi:hypothetical protein